MAEPTVELNELAAVQATTGQEIQRIITNFKKDSADRKQKKEYYEERLHKLEEASARFKAQDSKIRALEPQPSHPYFVKEYYNEVMAVVQQYQVIFRNAIRSITANNDDCPEENILPPTTSEVANSLDQPRAQNGLVRRLSATSASLDRLLSGLSNAQEDSSYYNIKIESIKKLWNQIESTNLEIWEKYEDPTLIGHNIQGHIDLEQRVQNHLVELSNKAEKCKTSNAPASTTFGVGKVLPLPKVIIPKFDGNYLKWRQFYDLFCQLIHNQTLPNVQKMWYLKTNLTGEAEHLIRHLTLTEENYDTAWTLLQERYNNMRLLTGTLIQTIVNQPTGTSTVAAIKGLHDTTQESLLALNNLGIDTSTWDPILLHILVTKLDKSTKILYERSIKQPREVPKLDDFLKFIENQFQTMESIGDTNKSQTASRTCTSAVVNGYSCKLCKTGVHPLFACKRFLQQTISDRSNFVRKQKLCINCLKAGHMANQCASRGCTKCNKKHNTLLHFESRISDAPGDMSNKEKTSEATTLAASRDKRLRPYVLLSTAIIKIITDDGREENCRVILDSGSQINLVTERLVRRLGISPRAASLNIQGIGESNSKSQKRINVKINSRINGFSTRLEAFVLDQIIANQPSQEFEISNWPIPKNVVLADPDFNTPARIDALLGAEFYHQLLSIGQIKMGEGLPVLQNTVFGWILSGKISHEHFESPTCGICTEDENLNVLVERMWQLDEVTTINGTLSPSEQRCETHFTQNTVKNEEGRFTVKLPFIDDPTSLGESRGIAMNRFLALERRLTKDENLGREYAKFMNEYIRLGHMTEIDINDALAPNYFIPHHCVIKPESSTTKLRVVFDASAKTTSGKSLNDIMHIGPTTQSELFSILLRFRLPRFVFTTDIEKMYRQILIHPDDRRYQLILWRDNPKSTIKCYQLNTVTYGTRSAPYLATRCLQQVARDNKVNHPLGAQVLKDNFYVDDGLGGSDSLSEAIEVQRQLNHMLKSAGFNLRKWCANHPQLLKNIPHDDQEVNLDFSSESNESIKTLGLTWLPKADKFCVKVNLGTSKRITKRTITSDLAKLFDPLGIMAPVVVTAKLFIQELWHLKMSWDEALPAELHTRWDIFRKNLSEVKNLQISRHMFKGCVPESVQIHAFGDASEKAFGAAVYIRSVFKDGRVIVRLLCAKSRVAPLKRQTLPRLELCAAVLCAQLTTRVKNDLHLKNSPIFLWTDSEIVLSWINSTSSSFQTFVANRVAVIQELTLAEQWRHVSSKDNPADVLSRGLTPKTLATCNLWFYGPYFLHGNETVWPPKFAANLAIPENSERKKTALPSTLLTVNQDAFMYTINHRNSIKTLQLIVGYVLRFIKNARTSKESRQSDINLTTKELDDALIVIIQHIQKEDFREDITHLKRHKKLKAASKISNLSPFIDGSGTLRVGGRLEAADLTSDAKHQMLLPYNDPIVKLLMQQIHIQNKHCAPDTLLGITRARFWPIKGKIIARAIVQQCIRCNKAKPKLLSQIMGNLPATRVTPARPFINSGVDYCGPFMVHFKIRGKKPQKAYIAVFCCFATKAVHLELVSDLTTEAFIGALKRFISRRGHCQNLYSDNATNFVGAKNKLAELTSAIHSAEGTNKITRECSNRGIQFNFIPPRAPHFGGLWEAAVKSAKNLLLRSVATASLTYEELETVVVEIEAILNSRPLTPMSEDPNDLTALTPGHLLIGEPLTAQIDATAEPLKTNLITRWKLVSHLKHEFWRRWSRDYLCELQYKHKWKTQSNNVQPGDMVIIKEDNIPVLQWPLGRVVTTYKGNDGAVRVVDVKTSSGVFKRAIHRLAPLPIDSAPNQPTTISETSKETTKETSSTLLLTETSAIPKKRGRMSCSLGVLTTMMTILMLPLVLGAQIENNKFGSKLGIHFEDIGSATISTTEWNLFVYYDLQSYWAELTALASGTTNLRQLCKQMREHGSCQYIVNHFEKLNEELQMDNKHLYFKRTKRGAINIVGNVASSLFGVLDSEYAEHMSKTISQVKENEGHLLNLFKNQTSIIDSTINIIKEDEVTTHARLNQLNQHLNQIVDSIQETKGEMHEFSVFQLFTSLSTQLMFIILNVQRIQSSIFDVLTTTHHGRISPLLLTPVQLREELAKIRIHFPSSVELPVNLDDPLQLYKLMTVEGGITKDHVLFKVTLPLAEHEQFELFKLIPIPNLVNNTMLAITPCAHVLAINSHRDQYFPITEAALQSCAVINKEKHLCTNIQIRHNSGSELCSCEMNLFNNNTKPNCSVNKILTSVNWYPLEHKNQWIYAMNSSTKATIVCGKDISQIHLSGAGHLKLEPTCVLKHNFISVQGQTSICSDLRASYTSVGHILEVTNPEKLKPLLVGHIHSKEYTTHAQNLTALKKLLATSDIMELSTTLKANNYHHHAIGYSALILSLAALLYFIYDKYNRSKTPIPKPRQHTSTSEFTMHI